MTYKEQITSRCTDRYTEFTAWKLVLSKYSMKLRINSQQRLVEKTKNDLKESSIDW